MSSSGFITECVCVADLMIPHHHTDLFSSSVSLSARHGDGLYDSYMRTDHILKDEADTNSPSGLPPMPKHTVSVHTSTHIHTHRTSKAVFPVLKHTLSPDILFLREIFPPQPCSYSPHLRPSLYLSLMFGRVVSLSLLLSLTSVIQTSFNALQ